MLLPIANIQRCEEKEVVELPLRILLCDDLPPPAPAGFAGQARKRKAWLVIIGPGHARPHLPVW